MILKLLLSGKIPNSVISFVYHFPMCCFETFSYVFHSPDILGYQFMFFLVYVTKIHLGASLYIKSIHAMILTRLIWDILPPDKYMGG